MLRFVLIVYAILFVSILRADEFDTLRLKWRDTIVGAGYDTADTDVAARLASIASTANTYWSSLDKSVSRTYLWSDAASTTVSADITTNYSRLRAMALAYATSGCSLQGNATLLSDISGGLDWMYTNRYNPTKSIYDNWYEFEIGSPIQITDIAVLLYDQLTATQLTNNMNTVEKFTPSATTQATGGTSGTFTGANRMWKIRAVAVRGCVVKASAKMAAARDAFGALFVYSTSSDGFYTDGSYLQHTFHPYTAGYGSSLLGTIVPVMAWLSGSTWAVTDPAQSNMFQWVYDSFEPIIYRGAAWDLVRGREISRSSGSPQATGHSLLDSIMQMAQFAPTGDAARMKSMVKYWAQNDTIRNFITNRPLPTLPMAKQLMADAGVTPRGELTGHYTFAEMDRVIHLGKGYGLGLSMSSSRIANFESINGENLKGWFTGDGMTILYNADLNQFGDAYWPTIDAYRLPGITADTTAVKTPSVPNSIGPRAQGQGTLTAYNWVGGATLGKFGAAGMQLDGWSVTLTGKKSWFMFDDEIVCLGAGITSTDARPIETTVENRKLTTAGTNAFTVNGVAKPATLAWSETMSSVNWAHLVGNVTGSDIGYYFPQASTLKAVREARSGAWADIDDGASATSITRNYLRFGFDHGSSPTNATYQYVLLPGRTARRVSQYAAAPQVSVIANNGNVQAVSETTLGITAANFWTDTSQTAGGITVDKKCSVMVQNDGAFIDVAISDPTQANTGTVTMQLSSAANTMVSADSAITVMQITPNIAMTVNVNAAQGQTFHARFYIGTAQVVNVTPEADTYVYDAAASVDSNFGTATSFTVKKSGTGFNRESYLRFNVPVWNGLLVGASLKLMPISVSTPGVHGVAEVTDNIWIESGAGGMTWNTKPASSATVLATWTPALSTQVGASVLGAITGSGQKSFRVYATTQTADGFVNYASRENGTTANRPQLTLSTGHSPPAVAITSPGDGDFINHQGGVSITADALGTDGSITSVAFYDGASLLGSATVAPYSFNATLNGGAHQLTAVATDSNGLTKTSIITRIDIASAPVTLGGTVATAKDTSSDIDLRTLASDVDTALTALRFNVASATNGNVILLADGHTARFTPAAGYYGPATFAFTTTDTSNDDRMLLNYDFQGSSVNDRSGLGRDGSINIQGTGAVSYTATVPAALAQSQTQSLQLTENSTAGAARVEYMLQATELDLKNVDWTAAGWFKRNTAINQDSILHIGESGGFGSNALTLAFYGTTTTIQLQNYNVAVNDVNISKTNVTTGAWHHFAVVRTGTTISLYIDGALAGSDSTFGFSFDTIKPVKFGGVTTTVLDRWFNGSLADLAIFNAALTVADIGKLNAAPAAYLGGQSAGNSVAVTVLSPLESWRLSKFGTTANTDLAADTADNDHDGIANLIEYATGMNPALSDKAPVSTTKNSNTLDFVYTRNKAAIEVTYTVEWSDTLGNDWSTAGVGAPVVLSDNGTTQQIKVAVPAGTGTARRFVRLKVTSP